MPKYYYIIELWKCLKISKWSNLELFTRLPRLLRRGGDEQEKLAYTLTFVQWARHYNVKSCLR